MGRYVLPLMLAAFTFTAAYAQEERPQGPATPEELIKAYVHAMRDGDESSIETLLPDVARLHQKVKVFAQRMDEKLKLDKEWKQELEKRFADRKDDRFSPPVDIQWPVKPKPIVTMRPEFTAVLIEKNAVDNNTVQLVIETAESKLAEKRRVKWQATRVNNRWVLSVPEMKQAADLYEKTMASLAGTDDSHRAMRQTLADLQQGKFTKYEDAEAAWKKVSEIKLKLAGDREFTLLPPGPRLPSPDGRASTTTTIEFRLADKLAADGLDAMKLPGSRDTIYVARDAILTHRDIQKVSSQGDRATTIITFNEASQAKLKQVLDKPEYRMLAVLADGKLIAAPLIDNKITERLIINGVDRSYFDFINGK